MLLRGGASPDHCPRPPCGGGVISSGIILHSDLIMEGDELEEHVFISSRSLPQAAPEKQATRPSLMIGGLTFPNPPSLRLP